MAAPSLTESMGWLRALNDPALATSWSLGQWQRAIRLARRLRLLGRLAERIAEPGIEQRLPAKVQQHLRAERTRSRARLRALTWTMDQVQLVLQDLESPIVLLKGAAYVAQQLPIAPGRLPSDLDILVPKASIEAAQHRLMAHDWREVDLDHHDRRYYRDWSHEVPPMHNPRFELELDVHHGILPPVARVTVDSDLLLQNLVPSGLPGWRVLSPVDQVLHSAAHLFFDSELRNRVRDLVDLDGLFRHFGRNPSFWDDLTNRSHELGLAQPLALAVHYTSSWLGTEVPDSVALAIRKAGPGPIERSWLYPMLDAVLRPLEPDEPDMIARRVAAMALHVRYHWNRLPVHLLVPHLIHKSRNRRTRELEGDEDT